MRCELTLMHISNTSLVTPTTFIDGQSSLASVGTALKIAPDGASGIFGDLCTYDSDCATECCSNGVCVDLEFYEDEEPGSCTIGGASIQMSQ